MPATRSAAVSGGTSRVTLMRHAGCAGLLFLGMACRSMDERFAPMQRQMPLTLPIAFRIELEFFDLSLARAAGLVHAADPQSALLGARIDEHDLRARLTALSRSDADVVRAPRPSFVVEPEVSQRAAPRAKDSNRPAGTLASDNVEVTAKTSVSLDWQAYDLALDLRWFPDGAGPVTVASSTPMPKDLWLELDALPAMPNDNRVARAWIGFVRAVPVWPPTGDL